MHGDDMALMILAVLIGVSIAGLIIVGQEMQ